ncbi:hypothetical protein LINPERPRIM_LOCUS1427, partial [Linum perenne]
MQLNTLEITRGRPLSKDVRSNLSLGVDV